MTATEPRSNLMTWLLVAAVVGLIAINVGYILYRDGGDRAELGEEAPNFTLPTLVASQALGSEVELAALRGKAVLLEFWMTS